ncbi:oogenesis-related isoform X2 [Pimephales promelas]|uniref:oogenesis-related isoform X2 n=1 Tax=Pimephales promelas TaxID=90988 RepID=UPI0019557B15|nr:oogenesis-related isoform X2 [Pimephales promelas]KAG1939750.1 oogenesis-related [Pimephales promelas]KAG1939751.1 oogenesis-related [Pimephales promelas]
MTNQSNYTVESENTEGQEKKVVSKRGGFVSAVLCRISQSWPVRLTMRALRGFWWLFGFSTPVKAISPTGKEKGSSPKERQCRTGRKRLYRVTRLLLNILPRRIQRALGYPVCTSIGCAVSPEVSCSPTKPCGKGSKRKQDDLDEEEEVDQQSWVEALTQELAEEDHVVDPDYEPSGVETDSEEYRSHNDTESDLEIEKGVVVIKDLEMVVPPEA